jgi:hypothetical protein
MKTQVAQQPLAGAGETFIGQVDAAGECQRQQQRNQETTSNMCGLSTRGVTASVT